MTYAHQTSTGSKFLVPHPQPHPTPAPWQSQIALKTGFGQPSKVMWVHAMGQQLKLDPTWCRL